MPTAIPFLSLENLYVKNIDHTLFIDLNLEINLGEHWALIGDSDSGKNELLKVLAGNYHITGGEYIAHFYDNFIKPTSQNDPLFNYEKLVSLVSQKHNFKNLSNTRDFYYQQRYNASDSEDAPTVENYLLNINAVFKEKYWDLEKIVAALHLEDLLSKHLIKLSNGETKRLLLAEALLKNPSLLLLDHPFTGLDKNMRRELKEIFNKVAASGITIIMTTSPYEIPDIITHIAILQEKNISNIVSRKNFKASHLPIKVQPTINLNELKSLVSEIAAEHFDTIVKMENINVKYGEKIILDNIDWEVKPGERWSLSGPNGAGKTTLLSLIYGDNPQAYANKIILFDRRRGSGESIWDIKRKIGFVSPELYQYFPADFTCLQVVESGFYDSSGLYRKSNPVNAAKALRWMKLLNIDKEANLYLKNTSSDIQRLCLLARALVKNPPLLILDEPTQGLDHHQQNYFQKIIESICQFSQTTLIYVTHYQEELPGCINKNLKLEKGKIFQIF